MKTLRTLVALAALLLALPVFAGNGNGNPGGNSGGGTGTVTTSGSPASGNLTKFSGSTAITNGDLSGDITTSGTLAATLATVNSNTGSFGGTTAIPNFTVNGKGLITAAGTNVVIAPAGTLSGTTLNSSVVTSSLTSVGTLGNTTLGGTLTAGSLSTSGTIAGSLCRTSAGLVLYEVGANCFAGGGGGTVTSVTFTGDGTVLSATPSSAVTTTGTLTATLATQTANTVLGATSTTLAGLSMPSCSTSGSALKWTTGSGFSCNTAIAASTVTTNANLSGVVTSSGNTTSFGTFTSATLASSVSDETGSGALVFAGSPTLTGTVNAAAITASGVITGEALISPPSTLTISTSTFTPVAVASNTYRVVLVHASCPCTIANPSGTAVDGQRFIMEVWQSASGADLVTTWGGNYDFGTVGAPVLSVGANNGDFLGFSYSAQNSKYNYIGIQQGM